MLRREDLLLTSHLQRSLDMFMPCYGHLHLVLDEDVQRDIHAWLTVHERVRFHRLLDPQAGEDVDAVKELHGYMLQQWVMLWADRLVEPSAQFVLFLDTDTVLTMPVSCSSLFDDAGRPYVPYWTSWWQTAYFPACRELIHPNCSRSFMAFLPILFPTALFAPFRQHMSASMHSAKGVPLGSFNAMFAGWINVSDWRSFSQFVNLGNFQFHYAPDSLHAIWFPMAKEGPTGECRQFVPIGLHYGWLPCRYLEACPAGVNGEMFRNNEALLNYSNKYNHLTISLIQDLLHRGHCMQSFARAMDAGGLHFTQTLADERPELLAQTCDSTAVNSVHPVALPYGEMPPDMGQIYQRYQPMTVPGPICSFHAKA